MPKLKPPCLVVVRYILPAVSAHIAKELTERHGLKRSEVARKMGITPAAVTQYLESIRGGAAMDLIERSEEATQIIAKTADGLARDEFSVYDVLGNICAVCRAMRSSGLICKIHKDMLPSLKGRSECELPPQFCRLLKGNPSSVDLRGRGDE